jgi:hypothetical protein
MYGAQDRTPWEFLFSDAAEYFSDSTEGELQRCQWVSVSVVGTLEIAAEWYIRIYQPTLCYDQKMFWLILKPHHEPCNVRAAVSRELVSLAKGEKIKSKFTRTTVKFAKIFLTQLQESAEDGCLEFLLWQMIFSLASHVGIDTQDVEADTEHKK